MDANVSPEGGPQAHLIALLSRWAAQTEKMIETEGPLSKRQSCMLEDMKTKEGSVAVLSEWDHQLSLVRLSEITADAGGIRCLITPVPAPGLGLPSGRSEPIRMFAAWAIFSEDDLFWHARYVPWYLFFEQQLLQDVLTLAEAAARDGGLISYEKRGEAVAYFWIRDHERWDARRKSFRQDQSR